MDFLLFTAITFKAWHICLLSTYYVPDAILGHETILVDKTKNALMLMEEIEHTPTN